MSRKYLSSYKISFSQTSPWCLNPDVTVFACPESYADRAHMLVMLHVGGFIPLPLFPHCKTLPLPQFFLRKYENTNPQFTGCKSNQLVPALLLELPLNMRAFTSRCCANIHYVKYVWRFACVFSNYPKSMNYKQGKPHPHRQISNIGSCTCKKCLIFPWILLIHIYSSFRSQIKWLIYKRRRPLHC